MSMKNFIAVPEKHSVNPIKNLLIGLTLVQVAYPRHGL